MSGAVSILEEVKIGESAVRFEPPDTLYFEIVGSPHAADAIKIMDAATRLSEGKDYLLVINDITRASEFPAEARKVVAARLATLPVRATALFGASFQLRVLVTLAFKIRDFIRGEPANPTRFCATEAEARAWIDEQRSRIERAA
jgi:hypothetical protein